jgi:hypothetical protein
VLESPYGAPTPDGVARNVSYAKRAFADCLRLGDAPIASHLLFTQDGILDDAKPDERKLGMAAGHAWIPVAEAMVVYSDHGISDGMCEAVKIAAEYGVPVEYRKIGKEESPWPAQAS